MRPSGGGPTRDEGNRFPRLTDSGSDFQKIDSIEIAKALGTSRIVYVGNSKDLLDLYSKARHMLERLAASCDEYDDEPHDEPLTDD